MDACISEIAGNPKMESVWPQWDSARKDWLFSDYANRLMQNNTQQLAPPHKGEYESLLRRVFTSKGMSTLDRVLSEYTALLLDSDFIRTENILIFEGQWRRSNLPRISKLNWVTSGMYLRKTMSFLTNNSDWEEFHSPEGKAVHRVMFLDPSGTRREADVHLSTILRIVRNSSYEYAAGHDYSYFHLLPYEQQEKFPFPLPPSKGSFAEVMKILNYNGDLPDYNELFTYASEVWGRAVVAEFGKPVETGATFRPEMAEWSWGDFESSNKETGGPNTITWEHFLTLNPDLQAQLRDKVENTEEDRWFYFEAGNEKRIVKLQSDVKKLKKQKAKWVQEASIPTTYTDENDVEWKWDGKKKNWEKTAPGQEATGDTDESAESNQPQAKSKKNLKKRGSSAETPQTKDESKPSGTTQPTGESDIVYDNDEYKEWMGQRARSKMKNSVFLTQDTYIKKGILHPKSGWRLIRVKNTPTYYNTQNEAYEKVMKKTKLQMPTTFTGENDVEWKWDGEENKWETTASGQEDTDNANKPEYSTEEEDTDDASGAAVSASKSPEDLPGMQTRGRKKEAAGETKPKSKSKSPGKQASASKPESSGISPPISESDLDNDEYKKFMSAPKEKMSVKSFYTQPLAIRKGVAHPNSGWKLYVTTKWGEVFYNTRNKRIQRMKNLGKPKDSSEYWYWPNENEIPKVGEEVVDEEGARWKVADLNQDGVDFRSWTYNKSKPKTFTDKDGVEWRRVGDENKWKKIGSTTAAEDEVLKKAETVLDRIAKRPAELNEKSYTEDELNEASKAVQNYVKQYWKKGKHRRKGTIYVAPEEELPLGYGAIEEEPDTVSEEEESGSEGEESDAGSGDEEADPSGDTFLSADESEPQPAKSKVHKVVEVEPEQESKSDEEGEEEAYSGWLWSKNFAEYEACAKAFQKDEQAFSGVDSQTDKTIGNLINYLNAQATINYPDQSMYAYMYSIGVYFAKNKPLDFNTFVGAFRKFDTLLKDGAVVCVVQNCEHGLRTSAYDSMDGNIMYGLRAGRSDFPWLASSLQQAFYTEEITDIDYIENRLEWNKEHALNNNYSNVSPENLVWWIEYAGENKYNLCWYDGNSATSEFITANKKTNDMFTYTINDKMHDSLPELVYDYFKSVLKAKTFLPLRHTACKIEQKHGDCQISENACKMALIEVCFKIGRNLKNDLVTAAMNAMDLNMVFRSPTSSPFNVLLQTSDSKEVGGNSENKIWQTRGFTNYAKLPTDAWGKEIEDIKTFCDNVLSQEGFKLDFDCTDTTVIQSTYDGKESKWPVFPIYTWTTQLENGDDNFLKQPYNYALEMYDEDDNIQNKKLNQYFKQVKNRIENNNHLYEQKWIEHILGTNKQAAVIQYLKNKNFKKPPIALVKSWATQIELQMLKEKDDLKLYLNHVSPQSMAQAMWYDKDNPNRATSHLNITEKTSLEALVKRCMYRKIITALLWYHNEGNLKNFSVAPSKIQYRKDYSIKGSEYNDLRTMRPQIQIVRSSACNKTKDAVRDRFGKCQTWWEPLYGDYKFALPDDNIYRFDGNVEHYSLTENVLQKQENVVRVANQLLLKGTQYQTETLYAKQIMSKEQLKKVIKFVDYVLKCELINPAIGGAMQKMLSYPCFQELLKGAYNEYFSNDQLYRSMISGAKPEDFKTVFHGNDTVSEFLTLTTGQGTCYTTYKGYTGHQKRLPFRAKAIDDLPDENLGGGPKKVPPDKNLGGGLKKISTPVYTPSPVNETDSDSEPEEIINDAYREDMLNVLQSFEAEQEKNEMQIKRLTERNKKLQTQLLAKAKLSNCTLPNILNRANMANFRDSTGIVSTATVTLRQNNERGVDMRDVVARTTKIFLPDSLTFDMLALSGAQPTLHDPLLIQSAVYYASQKYAAGDTNKRTLQSLSTKDFEERLKGFGLQEPTDICYIPGRAGQNFCARYGTALSNRKHTDANCLLEGGFEHAYCDEAVSDGSVQRKVTVLKPTSYGQMRRGGLVAQRVKLIDPGISPKDADYCIGCRRLAPAWFDFNDYGDVDSSSNMELDNSSDEEFFNAAKTSPAPPPKKKLPPVDPPPKKKLPPVHPPPPMAKTSPAPPPSSKPKRTSSDSSSSSIQCTKENTYPPFPPNLNEKERSMWAASCKEKKTFWALENAADGTCLWFSILNSLWYNFLKQTNQVFALRDWVEGSHRFTEEFRVMARNTGKPGVLRELAAQVMEDMLINKNLYESVIKQVYTNVVTDEDVEKDCLRKMADLLFKIRRKSADPQKIYNDPCAHYNLYVTPNINFNADEKDRWETSSQYNTRKERLQILYNLPAPFKSLQSQWEKYLKALARVETLSDALHPYGLKSHIQIVCYNTLGKFLSHAVVGAPDDDKQITLYLANNTKHFWSLVTPDHVTYVI